VELDKAIRPDSSFTQSKLLTPEKDAILKEHYMSVAMGIDHDLLIVVWDSFREKDANCTKIATLGCTEIQL
jgi:hypothetical protein